VTGEINEEVVCSKPSTHSLNSMADVDVSKPTTAVFNRSSRKHSHFFILKASIKAVSTTPDPLHLSFNTLCAISI